jgi:hypothetical protein
MTERDIGVPDARARALRHLADRVPPERIDRLWIFPPLSRGRRESGVIAVSCFAGHEGRRLLFTLSYRAEETGKGVTFEPGLHEEGEAPEDRIPKVIHGVVRRAGGTSGEPRKVSIEGSGEAYGELIAELSVPSTARVNQKIN